MAEKLGTPEKSYPSPEKSLKALENKTGYNSSVKEKMDTIENFCEKLVVLGRLLDEVSLSKKKHQKLFQFPTSSNSSGNVVAISIYYEKTNNAKYIIDELKNSKAAVTQKELDELLKLERVRNSLI